MTSERWRIAVLGTLLQVCLGTVYAWSYFQKPIVESYGWSNAAVAGAFSVAICGLGLAAAAGGLLLPKYGPRRLAMLGGALFAAGYLIAGLALQWRSILLFYAGYGVVGGIGIGLGYVTPVATVARWFPDRKGLMTGMVIMGFGFGALLMSKALAPALMRMASDDVAVVFLVLGCLFGAVAPAVAAGLRNPPAGYLPPGWTALTGEAAGAAEVQAGGTVREALRSKAFATLWTVFFCNILAGISIIGFQSPLLQDLWRKAGGSPDPALLAARGATLIAISSVFNGLGRLFWGWVSDRAGRVVAFRLLLGSQVLAFAALTQVHEPRLFGALVCYVLLCYGGGFGVMPSFALDVFGPRRMGAVYGWLLTAWSAAGILGPQMVATLKDRQPERSAMLGFGIAACFLAVGFALSLTWPRHGPEAAEP